MSAANSLPESAAVPGLRFGQQLLLPGAYMSPQTGRIRTLPANAANLFGKLAHTRAPVVSAYDTGTGSSQRSSCQIHEEARQRPRAARSSGARSPFRRILRNGERTRSRVE